MTTDADHAYRVVIEDRIRELWRYRHWLRHTEDYGYPWLGPVMRGLAADYDFELRVLLKLRREARRMTRPRIVVDLALGDHYAGMPR